MEDLDLGAVYRRGRSSEVIRFKSIGIRLSQEGMIEQAKEVFEQAIKTTNGIDIDSQSDALVSIVKYSVN